MPSTNRQPHRIIAVKLNLQGIATSTAEIEMERHKVVSDLLAENSFILKNPANAEGPYALALSLQDKRLMLQVRCTTTSHREDITIPLAPLQRHIHDYTILCESFYKTAKEGQIHRLEALDEGRRSIHDESAELLAETLENKVKLDKGTARRLFSLIYVLHIRNATNLG